MSLTFRVPADEVKELRRLAHARGTNISAEIRRAVRLMLADGR
jgi:Ribbon-helix-helix protein, copG family